MFSDDDSSFVLAEDFSLEEIALGSTKVDLVACSIAELSDRQINAMTERDLKDLVQVANPQAWSLKLNDQVIKDVGELRSVVRRLRDEYRTVS